MQGPHKQVFAFMSLYIFCESIYKKHPDHDGANHMLVMVVLAVAQGRPEWDRAGVLQHSNNLAHTLQK